MSKIVVYEKPEYVFNNGKPQAVDTWPWLKEPELKQALQAVNEHYGLRLGKRYLVLIKNEPK